MNSQSLAQKFGYWSIGLSREGIPSNVLVAARRAILDTIGVSTAGLEHAKVKSLKNALVGYFELLNGGQNVDEEAATLLKLASKLLHHEVETHPPIAKEETKDWKNTVALHQSA